METAVKKLYEALFLVDSANDWNTITDYIRQLLDKYEADIITMKKWDERRLAYEVRGKNRGLYILVYFNCPGKNISSIERDVQLSEQVMRVLILNTEVMSQEDIERQTPDELVLAQQQEDNFKKQADNEPADRDNDNQDRDQGRDEEDDGSDGDGDDDEQGKD